MGYYNLTVNQLQQLHEIKTDIEFDKRVQQYAIVKNKSIEYAENLSLIKLYKETNFLYNPIPNYPVRKRYGKYQPITNLVELTTAQHKDLDIILKSNGGDWIKCAPELLSILNKELTVKGYKYKPEHHEAKIRAFKKAKISKVIGTIFFYTNYSSNSSYNTKDYLEAQELIKETMTMIMEDLEFQTFIKDGGGITA